MKCSPSLLVEFQAEAELRYPNEACGFVVKKGRKQAFVPCVNSASEPGAQFLIDEDEYVRASGIGEILAVWHSHPDTSPNPSDVDRFECENSELPWLINSITKTDEEGFVFSETVLLEPAGIQLDYIGRPYSYGAMDCYTLACDYYKREFGIKLDPLRWTRKTRFWEGKDAKPVMELAAPGLNMVRLVNTPPKKGDLFVISVGSAHGNHVAIYIGDDMILHHCEGRLSARSVYGGFWEKHTIGHYRHTQLMEAE